MIHSYHCERRARYSTQCESVQTSGPQAHTALRGWRKVGHMHFAERLDRNISRSAALYQTRFAHSLERQEQDSAKPRNALNVTNQEQCHIRACPEQGGTTEECGAKVISRNREDSLVLNSSRTRIMYDLYLTLDRVELIAQLIP